jgi:peptide/nickel transport system substrate-binding protein
MKADQVIKRLTVAWLILDDVPADSIDPGESRVGTPAGEFFIGVVGQLQDMDPAALAPDFVNWEIMNNSMSGLYGFNVENELYPILAEAPPSISEDKLEYTIRLRPDLLFPDGSDFTAEDVRWSVIRASRLGNFLVNSILKDSNEDSFADVDGVQVLDPLTVKFVLQEPTAYFPSLLAAPPYFPISSECYAETADPGSSCGGLGPYTITHWSGGDRIHLEANPQWPGRPAPAFENIIVRFYDDPDGMRKSLAEFQSIDLAWTGLPYEDFVELQDQDINGDGIVDIAAWDGPSTFKSYLIFEQGEPPWNNKKVRQAAAYALDREAIVQDVFAGSRLSLYSPVPDEVPGHVASLPAVDHDQVRSLMLEVGYTAENPLEITIWFVNDGRYSPQEEQYLIALGEQLESTGVFLVNIEGAPWEQFRVQISQCGYQAYLLGWPSPGRPVDYLDPSSWTDFFVQETDSVFCSNYESSEMADLVQAAREEIDPALRMDIYAQIQELWANELPTLDVSQEPRRALSLTKVDGVGIDALGLLHYELLTKSGG